MTNTLHVLRVSEILSMVEGFLCIWLQENIYTFLLFVWLTPSTYKYFINDKHITCTKSETHHLWLKAFFVFGCKKIFTPYVCFSVWLTPNTLIVLRVSDKTNIGCSKSQLTNKRQAHVLWVRLSFCLAARKYLHLIVCLTYSKHIQVLVLYKWLAHCMY